MTTLRIHYSTRRHNAATAHHLAGGRNIRVPLKRSCQVNRSRSIHAHQNPAPANNNDTLAIA